MKNILIFGANSQLSLGLIRIHLDLGDKITAIYHLNTHAISDKVTYTDLKSVLESTATFDVVYMIGSFVPRGKYNEPNDNFYLSNIFPFEKLTKKFSEARFIMASSVAVYGNNQEEISESTAISPLNLYAKSKLEGERLIQAAHHYCILRFTSIYGKINTTDNFIDRCIKQAKDEGKIVLYGNGKRKQNYIFIEDAVQMLYLASKSNHNGILLGTSDFSVENKEVAEFIAYKTGAIIEYVGDDLSESLYYSNKYTKTILNFAPLDTLKGIEKILLVK